MPCGRFQPGRPFLPGKAREWLLSLAAELNGESDDSMVIINYNFDRGGDEEEAV